MREKTGSGAVTQALADLEKKAAALEGTARGFPGAPGSGGSEPPGLARLNADLALLLETLQDADQAPTSAAAAAVKVQPSMLAQVLDRWSEIKRKDVEVLNQRLKMVGLPLPAMP